MTKTIRYFAITFRFVKTFKKYLKMKDYTTNNFKKKIFAKKGSNQNKKDIYRINLYKNFILLI
ncbi:hypothetical protein rpr22_0886 [Rickettsia prowazekii str. Rp22]|uniref:Uncharacterized protein n=1 Tax=Rickettsia prowazekii (strain Rp22) TaxID=449216 RepID=D5AYA6_RICPP|nr:hypothetical protein rpr22_0886 [Rickettsia prowazekii str. Rp22]